MTSVFECHSLYIYILLLVFLSLILYVYYLNLQQRNLYIRESERGSWFLMKGATLRVHNHGYERSICLTKIHIMKLWFSLQFPDFMTNIC